ncbi:MAG: hypothetical protein EAZ53_01170 [Bacteroidetes bacterium]|nr:MAG: hypothetical protein EAZ53_01170 [Bacteroidota bacterium]
MDIVTKNLEKIESCIKGGFYEEIETERFEIKNLSSGWGLDFYKTVCAFLNANGGIIIVGVHDQNNQNPKKYKFTGFENSNSNENFYKNELPLKFTDKENTTINLAINLDFEIKDFLNGRVLIVYVKELESERKFAFYDKIAYARKLTGDQKIDQREINEHEEAKKERIASQELNIIKNTDLKNINLDTLNNYIFEYSKGKKRGDKLKKSLKEANPFLVEQGFMFENNVTILGMLVCGDHPERYIQGKCQVDCYVVNANSKNLAESKVVIEDNIINLISESQNFIWRNIQIGIAYTDGGKAEPEYPEALIRESINNAIAHRSYKSDRFIIIEIVPHSHLLIRNPGMFQQRQRIFLNTENGKIRRIKPFQVTRNPKLTHLLKSFNYWEGKGKGLSSLIDACLDNQIDLPYYVLSEDEISLCIPKGKVLDVEMESWLNSFSGYIFSKLNRILSQDEKIILSFLKKSEELNRSEKYTILLTSNNNHANIISTLEEFGLIFVNKESTELYPIYQIDRILLKNNFNEELKDIFNTLWTDLGIRYKNILNAIYLRTFYGNHTEMISANSIGNFLYLNEYKKINDLRHYDTFKRTVRSNFNILESKKMIIRKDGLTKSEGGEADFIINSNFKI